jgi:hypothetical protein
MFLLHRKERRTARPSGHHSAKPKMAAPSHNGVLDPKDLDAQTIGALI